LKASTVRLAAAVVSSNDVDMDMGDLRLSVAIDERRKVFAALKSPLSRRDWSAVIVVGAGGTPPFRQPSRFGSTNPARPEDGRAPRAPTNRFR